MGVKVDGKVMKRIHASFVILFAIIWIAAAIFGWLSSVVFVSHMSMVALVYAAASAWQGAKAEEASEKES